MLNQSTTSIAYEREKQTSKYEKYVERAKVLGIKFNKENKLSFEADEDNLEEAVTFEIKKGKQEDYEGAWILYVNGEEEYERFFSKKNAIGFITKYHTPHKLWQQKIKDKL